MAAAGKTRAATAARAAAEAKKWASVAEEAAAEARTWVSVAAEAAAEAKKWASVAAEAAAGAEKWASVAAKAAEEPENWDSVSEKAAAEAEKCASTAAKAKGEAQKCASTAAKAASEVSKWASIAISAAAKKRSLAALSQDNAEIKKGLKEEKREEDLVITNPKLASQIYHCFVIVRGFHVPSSVIMGPRIINMMKETTNQGLNEEYSRLYEWRLNLKTRTVAGKYLTGMEVALEFPVINDKYVGLRHKYAYAQVADSPATLAGGPGIVRPKFGGFAKFLLDEKEDITTKDTGREDIIKTEYHYLDRNQFCSGATFVPKVNGASEDDGWIVSYVHDEGTNKSEVHIINARRFGCGPIAKITLPQRVPYVFHGTFVSKRDKGEISPTRL